VLERSARGRRRTHRGDARPLVGYARPLVGRASGRRDGAPRDPPGRGPDDRHVELLADAVPRPLDPLHPERDQHG
jgi:hypothetical protein